MDSEIKRNDLYLLITLMVYWLALIVCIINS
jgi:hypothetical protein